MRTNKFITLSSESNIQTDERFKISVNVKSYIILGARLYSTGSGRMLEIVCPHPLPVGPYEYKTRRACVPRECNAYNEKKNVNAILNGI